ncbi:MAG TPA: ABC transporter substrate-binding protein [Chloroflexota bacterium]
MTSLDQLTGKTIGIASPGSAGQTILWIALKLKGVDPAGVQFVSIGGTNARVSALLAGKIDGAPAHVAEATVAEDTGKVKTLMTTGDVMGPYLQSGLIASGARLKANPQLAQKVVDAFIDASRWAGSDKAGYIELSKKLVPKMTDAQRDQSYELCQKIKLCPTDGGRSADNVSHSSTWPSRPATCPRTSRRSRPGSTRLGRAGALGRRPAARAAARRGAPGRRAGRHVR